MRIAILTDPHGNSIALDAVLTDIESSGGVDGYWVLGDLCAMGPDPIGVAERLRALAHAQFVHGNTDSWLVKGMDFFAGEVSAEAIPARAAMTSTLAWTRGMLTASGHLGWLSTLPLEWRVTLPDGTRVLCVHASPGTDDGPGFHPAHEDAAMAERAASADADLVFVGHTHWPMSRQFGSVHVVNPGPVHLQTAPDFRAKYVLLEADESGYSITFRYVDYDRDAVVGQLGEHHHPAEAYITNMIVNGLNVWMPDDGTQFDIPPDNVKMRNT